MIIKEIDIKDLKLNNGQIEGVPKNPRFIKDFSRETWVDEVKGINDYISEQECFQNIENE